MATISIYSVIIKINFYILAFLLHMNNQVTQTIRIDDPLYNSRIIKMYVEYLQKYHPQVNVDALLQSTWINSYEVEDQGHWFSQWQVDRFHELLNKEAGIQNISREVGRFSVSSKASGALRQYLLGFMTPAAGYWVLEKIAPHMTRGHTFTTHKLGTNKIEVTVRPKQDIDEKPYQCENRIGQLEALPKLFSNQYAKIEHPVCIHKGGDHCRYIVSWEKLPSFKLKRVRYGLICLSLCAFASLDFFNLPFPFAALIFISATLMVGIAYYSCHIEIRELSENIEGQRESARLLLDQINMRYSDAQLIKEIGQATAMLLDIKRLNNSVVESMKKHLDYDRGGIWLANKQKTHLTYQMGYGYRPAVEEVLKGSRFRLDNPRSRGVVIMSFRQRRPFLINDISEIKQDLSKRSVKFVEKIGAQSFICVPIVYEGESLGVLLVDNLRSKRQLSQSDISLLSGVATQIAISIHNAMSYQKMQESRERESKLRQLFERYVPAPIIKRYTDSEGTELFRGDEQSITAMFLDIRGFTTSSERMDAKDVVSFLNGFFDKCSAIISAEGGHINKYTGDGFFSIFGAPEPMTNHALLAFNAALKILKFSAEIQLAGKTMGLGIGLHAGNAILGNIGSQTKIEYTAVGDTVNTAARLQELTKLYQNFPIIMSKDTRDRLGGHPEHDSLQSLGEQIVRGKKEKLDAYGFEVHHSPASSKAG